MKVANNAASFMQMTYSVEFCVLTVSVIKICYERNGVKANIGLVNTDYWDSDSVLSKFGQSASLFHIF